MKKIYDCFTFFNELELLEIRFEELYDVVDYFVLVESDFTFMNNPKPYHFEENKERYARFLDKVIHIKSNSNCYENPWDNEHFQRNSILDGIVDASPDDIIIISDVDELIRPSVLGDILQSDSNLFLFEMPSFFYKFNFVETAVIYPWSMASNALAVKELDPETMRKLRLQYFRRDPAFFERYPNFTLIQDAGWHFGYLGDNEFVKNKFNNYSHAPEQNSEYVKNFDMNSELYSSGSTRVPVCIDEYFPKTIVNNIEKYQQYILPNAVHSIKDCIKQTT